METSLANFIDLPVVADPRGNLCFVESGEHVPFEIKRVYYLYDVPSQSVRAGHAHHELNQLLIALSGSFDVRLHDGQRDERITLNRPNRGLHIGPGTWRDIDNFSSGAVCLVLASAHYDEADYIRDFDDFLRGSAGMKFFDLGLDEPELRAAMDAGYRRVMDRGWAILGPELEAFEAEFATYCTADRAIGVGNGLDALVLALRAAGVGRDDEVVVPAHTFAATWLAVEAVGARPVPVEVDPDTYVLTAAAIATATTPRTRAVVPVSLYGHPLDMAPIMALAERHGLFVLEDAAQSHGALSHGQRTGSLAHATAFSFYPTKNLGAVGDAGAVTTSDAALAERLRMLRNYGSRKKYVHEIAGVNSRLDELQAAFLRARLARLDDANDRRRERAARYDQRLAGANAVRTPAAAAWARHVYHLYVVRSPDRDALQARLAQAGIETLIHYPTACHLQPAFAHLGYQRGAFPIAERLADEVLSPPLWPGMPLADVDHVAAAISAG